MHGFHLNIRKPHTERGEHKSWALQHVSENAFALICFINTVLTKAMNSLNLKSNKHSFFIPIVLKDLVKNKQKEKKRTGRS